MNSCRQLTRLPNPEPSLFDVRPFLERMVHLAMHQVKENGIKIEVIEVSSDLMVYADEQLIGQVVMNLLNNAIQAMETMENGLITLKAYCDQQENVIVEIANNGPVISSEIANQMFIPFLTTKKEGCGIGLSISRQIMRLSGGSLVLLPYKDGSQMTTFALRIA